MDFCDNCKNHLSVLEISENNERVLYYYCKKCNVKKQCFNNKVSFKKYKMDNNHTNDTQHINKYKAQDCTLPIKHCKCPKCKKINNNRYEVKYVNNSYNLNIICKNCHENFIF